MHYELELENGFSTGGGFALGAAYFRHIWSWKYFECFPAEVCPNFQRGSSWRDQLIIWIMHGMFVYKLFAFMSTFKILFNFKIWRKNYV